MPVTALRGGDSNEQYLSRKSLCPPKLDPQKLIGFLNTKKTQISIHSR